jgi:hypothetical protein
MLQAASGHFGPQITLRLENKKSQMARLALQQRLLD